MPGQELFFGRIRQKLLGSGTGALLVRAATGSLSIALLSAGVTFVLNLLLARWMGVAQYGVYVYVLGWMTLLVLPTTLGYKNSLVRFVSAYKARGEWDLLKGLLKRSIFQVTVVSIFAGIMLAVLTDLLGNSMRQELVVTFQISCLMLPLLALEAVRGAALRGLRRVIQAAVPEGVVKPLVILVLAAAVFLVGTQPLSAVQVMTINVLAALVAFTVASLWMRRALPSEINNHKARFETREWLFVSLPLLANGSMHLVMKQSDVLMLGSMNSTDAAGIYAVTSRLAGLVLFGLTAVNSILAPLISEYFAKKDMKKLQRTVTQAAWLTTAVAIPTICVLAIGGKWLLGLFGEQFVVGYVPLLILLIGFSINALTGSVGFLMSMTGHHNNALAILAGSALVNLGLNAMLIPRYGMVGAAIATSVAMILWNVAMLVFVKRRLGINPLFASRGSNSEP